MRRSASLAFALAFGAMLVTGAAALGRRAGPSDTTDVMWRRSLLQDSGSGNNDTSITFALLNSTGLLSNTTNSTLLIPNNDAYSELIGFLQTTSIDLGNLTQLLTGGGDQDSLVGNLTSLFSQNTTLSNLTSTVLLLHVIPNQMLYKDNITQLISSNGGNLSVPTAGGDNITLSSTDNSTINVSGPGNFEPGEVTDTTDLMLAGGNIGHVINRVLLPDLSVLGLAPPPSSDMSPPPSDGSSPPPADSSPPSDGGQAPPDGGIGVGGSPPPAV